MSRRPTGKAASLVRSLPAKCSGVGCSPSPSSWRPAALASPSGIQSSTPSGTFTTRPLGALAVTALTAGAASPACR